MLLLFRCWSAEKCLPVQVLLLSKTHFNKSIKHHHLQFFGFEEVLLTSRYCHCIYIYIQMCLYISRSTSCCTAQQVQSSNIKPQQEELTGNPCSHRESLSLVASTYFPSFRVSRCSLDGWNQRNIVLVDQLFYCLLCLECFINVSCETTDVSSTFFFSMFQKRLIP